MLWLEGDHLFSTFHLFRHSNGDNPIIARHFFIFKCAVWSHQAHDEIEFNNLLWIIEKKKRHHIGLGHFYACREIIDKHAEGVTNFGTKTPITHTGLHTLSFVLEVRRSP